MATIHSLAAAVWARDAADCDVKTNNQKSSSNPGLIGPVRIDKVQSKAARAIARYRELWPSLRAVAVHDAPAEVQ
jgi:hypothetical protein